MEKRSGRLVVVAKNSKERPEWRRLQRKNFSILGLLKRKGWPQRHRESSWQVRQSRLCQKERKQSHLSRAPNRKEGIQCLRSKENSSKGKKETSIPLQKDIESKSKKQSYPNELFENSRKGDVRWGKRRKKERWFVELVGDQNPGSEAPPSSKRAKEKGAKEMPGEEQLPEEQ